MDQSESHISLSSTEVEKFFTCPYCWEEISFLIDATQTELDFIEDCEVCCHPISVHCEIADGEIDRFEATKAQ